MHQVAVCKKREPKKGPVDTIDPRISTIIQMRRDKHSLREIGKRFGLTRARIGQIIKDHIVPHFEENVFESQSQETKLYSIDEVAKEFGESKYVIYTTIKQENIDVCMRGKKYFLTRESIGKLKEGIVKRRIGKCLICEEDFSFNFSKTGRKPSICYKKSCKKKYDGQRAIIRGRKEPANAKFVGWHKALWEKVKAQQRPKVEVWLTISEAANMSKLTVPQITYLRIVRLLETRPHPTKKVRGVPCHQYSYHDIVLAGDIWRSWQKSCA